MRNISGMTRSLRKPTITSKANPWTTMTTTTMVRYYFCSWGLLHVSNATQFIYMAADQDGNPLEGFDLRPADGDENMLEIADDSVQGFFDHRGILNHMLIFKSYDRSSQNASL